MQLIAGGDARGGVVTDAKCAGQRAVEECRHVFTNRLELRIKRFARGKSQRVPKGRRLLCIARQGLCLQVVAILQYMFNTAQKSVMLREFLRLLRRDFSGLRQRGQRRNCRLDSQTRIAPTTHQLPQLRAEFQLANATATQFDIVLIVLLGAQLCVQFTHTGDRVKVEITAEHKWRGQFGQRPG